MKKIDIQRIVFVWNADFSIRGGLRALSEVISNEHTCSLCEIAYHRITQTADWKSYKKTLAVEIREPCRNQLTKSEKNVAHGDFPIVLAHTSKGIIKLLGSQEINACNGHFDTFQRKLNSAIEQA